MCKCSSLRKYNSTKVLKKYSVSNLVCVCAAQLDFIRFNGFCFCSNDFLSFIWSNYIPWVQWMFAFCVFSFVHLFDNVCMCTPAMCEGIHVCSVHVLTWPSGIVLIKFIVARKRDRPVDRQACCTHTCTGKKVRIDKTMAEMHLTCLPMQRKPNVQQQCDANIIASCFECALGACRLSCTFEITSFDVHIAYFSILYFILFQWVQKKSSVQMNVESNCFAMNRTQEWILGVTSNTIVTLN